MLKSKKEKDLHLIVDVRGQGSDETRAEALAMKEHAIEQGYSEELI
ncbi:MAG: hypothetical protein ACLRQF_08065 [Thomasclavelia ramosa]